MNNSRQHAVQWSLNFRASPGRSLAGADGLHAIRSSSNSVGLRTTIVQKGTMASFTAIDRTDDQRAWQALVLRLAEGDEQALAQLYDSTNRIVYGLALRILGDPSSAEDVTMEVYLQVWRTAKSYDPRRGTVSSWLVTLVRSRAIDCLRSRKARRAELEDNVDDMVSLSDSRSSPESATVEAGRSRIVRKAMADLPSDQRKAIELAGWRAIHRGRPGQGPGQHARIRSRPDAG
jgi:RNA polymerase sigma-70 factor (ECF subfamily)